MEQAGRREQTAAYDRLIDNALAALAILTLPATILLVAFSDLLFLIYGRAYAGAFTVFMPMAAGIAISVMSAPMQFAIVAANRTWSLLVMSMTRAGILLVFALGLVPGQLAAGLAWASLAADIGFAGMVTEFAVRRRLASRAAGSLLYGYCMTALAGLAVAVALPSAYRWGVAVPLAAAVSIAIIRRHPEASVWIAGATPLRLRGAVRHGLNLVATSGLG
jgi:O-antigen/teichoic acid export membrane protein